MTNAITFRNTDVVPTANYYPITPNDFAMNHFQKKVDEAAIEVDKQRQLKELDFQLSEKKQIVREKIRVERELCSPMVFQSQDKLIKAEVPIIGTIKTVATICELEQLTIKFYQPMRNCNSEGIYNLNYVISGEPKRTLLFERERGKRLLVKRLQQEGVVFQVGKKFVKEIDANFEAYILGQAVKQLLPYTHGWNWTGNSWYFSGEEDITWEALICEKVKN